MKKSILTIRGRDYALPEASLTGDHAFTDGRHLLMFNIAAVAKKTKIQKNMAGVALNCIIVEGISDLRDLVGKVVSIKDYEEDSLGNEIRESVLVESGKTLEISSIEIRFEEIKGNSIHINLEANCFCLEGKKKEKDIPVTGEFWARMEKCRERLAL
jgi:hypothetical protein